MIDADGKNDFEEYKPAGPCATGCGHQATELFILYRGPRRFEFRCLCCIKRAAIDRALAAIAELPALEAAFHEAEAICK